MLPARKLQLPEYVEPLITTAMRYKVLYGGRGSGKSYAIADALLLLGMSKPIRVLCAREFQNSIAESVHYLLVAEIDRLGLSKFYSYTSTSITGKNGTEFIFKGIRMNIASIKSMAGITHVWLEEADTVSKVSWDVLIPTIREEGSEIWVSFNPNGSDDPTYEMFVTPEGNPIEREDAFILNLNWMDNPFFPEVLRKEKDFLYKNNPELADHVWGGKTKTHSDAQIFKGKWRVEEFEAKEEWYGPYHGADFGFSNDPSTLVKVYLDYAEMRVYIRHAKFGYHVEIDDLPEMYDQMPESRNHLIRADSQRPDTISFLNRKGFNIEGAEKGKGSVEDGIEWLRSFTIVIHPECSEMITEAQKYSYKVDRLTQEVLTDVVDAHNHGWDAVRYALEPQIKAGTLGILDVL